MFAAAQELLRRHPETGAIVLECQNMAPFSRILARTFRMPTYNVYT
jgi:hypothetical protein